MPETLPEGIEEVARASGLQQGRDAWSRGKWMLEHTKYCRGPKPAPGTPSGAHCIVVTPLQAASGESWSGSGIWQTSQAE